jgi:hypothetical protein
MDSGAIADRMAARKGKAVMTYLGSLSDEHQFTAVEGIVIGAGLKERMDTIVEVIQETEAQAATEAKS